MSHEILHVIFDLLLVLKVEVFRGYCLSDEVNAFGYELSNIAHVWWHEGHWQPKAVASVFEV